MGEQEMGKLLVYLKDYKKESVLGPLFKLLEASFELIVPLVMAAIIDHGVADGDKPYIMKMCLVLVLLAVIGLTCVFFLPSTLPPPSDSSSPGCGNQDSDGNIRQDK